MADSSTGGAPGGMDGFAAEVRAFLDANAKRRPDPAQAVQWGVGEDTIAYFSTDPPDVDRANADRARRWQGRRFDAGLGWITGPVEFGGRGLSTTAAEAAPTNCLMRLWD